MVAVSLKKIFFKQKTAYEIRNCDWSSDVCSSDLFASFSTVIAVFENIIACARENFGWDRRRACLVGAAALVVLGLPCALGYNVWSGIQPLGAGSTVLDFEDFLVSNVLLPGGSLVYLLFCVTKWGWGFDIGFEVDENLLI